MTTTEQQTEQQAAPARGRLITIAIHALMTGASIAFTILSAVLVYQSIR